MKNYFNQKPPWYSSYEINDFGEIFYSLILVYKPTKIVELGTKAGYSAYHMARALKENGKGKLHCYDLWDKYKYNSVPKSVAEKNLKVFKNIIAFKLCDAIDVDKKYKIIDILHIDLGNHGKVLNKIIPPWINKVRQLIIIEGGSSERDKIEWMLKYKKIPITRWLKDFKKKNPDIEYLTINKFPSLTLIAPCPRKK